MSTGGWRRGATGRALAVSHPWLCLSEDWGSEKQSPTFQLGDLAHLQAEVHTGRHIPLRLFVDYCVATLTPDQNASPHHTIVDFHG